MNAVFREDCEAPVITLKAVEAHLSHMQPDLSAVKAAMPVLRDKMDAMASKLEAKINESNRDRVSGDAALAEKIEQANKDRAAGDAALSEKIDQLSIRVDAKIDRLAAKVDEKIDRLSAKVDEKIDRLETRIDQAMGWLKWFEPAPPSPAALSSGTYDS